MTDPKRPLKVFLCHSSADKAKVREVYKFLQQQGFQPWLDAEDLLPGQDWNLEISKALDASDAIIIFLSKGSVSKEGYVQKEIKYALDRALEMPEGRIFIIPARFEDCDLPRGLKHYEWVNLYEEGGAEKLVKALNVRVTQLQGVEASTPSDGDAPKLKLPFDNSENNSKSLKETLGKRKLDTAIVVALIGVFGSIVAALIGSPLMSNLLIPKSTPTENITATVSIETPSMMPELTPPPSSTPDLPSTWQQGKIAYVARNPENVYFLYTTELSQSSRPEVLQSPDRPSKTRYYAPWFSPDGEWLAFTDNYLGKTFVLSATGENNTLRLVGDCYSPSFSPDGNYVVCHSREKNEFPVYDVKTGDLVRTISHGKTGAILPAWSPDGKEIAFSVLSDDGDASIWLVDSNGGVPVALATGAREDYAPAWSPDGEWIAYQSTLTSAKSQIWIMRRDGSEKQQITFADMEEVWSRGPCFSPDGNWLAFVSNSTRADEADFGDVFVISLLTGELHQVTDTDGYILDWRVTWTK